MIQILLKCQQVLEELANQKVLELIINELKESGVDEQDIFYMNFENLDFEEISDYKKLNTYVKEHKGKNKRYLFLMKFNMYHDLKKP